MSEVEKKPDRKAPVRLTADQKLEQLAAGKREEIGKLAERAKRLELEHASACNKLGEARAALRRYEAALPQTEPSTAAAEE